MSENAIKEEIISRGLAAKTYVAEDGTIGSVEDLLIMIVKLAGFNDDCDADIDDWDICLEVDLLCPETGVSASYTIWTYLDKSDPGWMLDSTNEWLPKSPLHIEDELALMRALSDDWEEGEPLYFDSNGSYGSATGMLYL